MKSKYNYEERNYCDYTEYMFNQPEACYRVYKDGTIREDLGDGGQYVLIYPPHVLFNSRLPNIFQYSGFNELAFYECDGVMIQFKGSTMNMPPIIKINSWDAHFRPLNGVQPDGSSVHIGYHKDSNHVRFIDCQTIYEFRFRIDYDIDGDIIEYYEGNRSDL